MKSVFFETEPRAPKTSARAFPQNRLSELGIGAAVVVA
jgi:hypothetical protein